MAWLDQRFGSANPAVKIFSPRRSSLTRPTTSQAPGPIGSPFLVGNERPERIDPAPPLDLLAGQEIAPDDVEARVTAPAPTTGGRGTRSCRSRIATRRSATGSCRSRPHGRTPATGRPRSITPGLRIRNGVVPAPGTSRIRRSPRRCGTTAGTAGWSWWPNATERAQVQEPGELQRFRLLERPRVEERDEIHAVVETLERVARAVEDSGRVVEPLVEQVAPAHQPDLPAQADVGREQRPLGRRQPVIRDRVLVVGERREEAAKCGARNGRRSAN